MAIGFACSAVVRFAVVPVTPAGLLERLREAFRARMARLVTAQLALLDAGPDEVDKALEEVRDGTARLHETALMIQSRLEAGTPDEPTARLVQRRIADAEIAAERLGLLLLSARSAERADTLTLHLPGAPAPEVGRMPGPDEATALLRRDLVALSTVVLRSGPSGTGVAQVRNRLLGYRDEEHLPAGSAAVRDVFRGIGEAARAVMGLRIALDGPQDESDDSPATARSRRSWTPRTPPSTRRRRRRRRARSRRGSSGPPPAPPSRWRSARRWPSSAVSCCPRTAGTGRC